MIELSKKEKAYFHLPGLFEFYELYKKFLPLFYNHREYFYDWCEIGSIYGAPMDCLWGGGRLGEGEDNPREVLDLMKTYHISARLTFSNSMLEEEIRRLIIAIFVKNFRNILIRKNQKKLFQ